MDLTWELQSPESPLPLLMPCPNAHSSAGSNQYSAYYFAV